MTVMSMAMLATMVQMPVLRDSSSWMSTLQFQEVRPRKSVLQVSSTYECAASSLLPPPPPALGFAVAKVSGLGTKRQVKTRAIDMASGFNLLNMFIL